MRQPAKRLGINGYEEVKLHPWFQDFDWCALEQKTIKPSFIPDLSKNNFDNAHVNLRAWNDTEECQESAELLRRASQKLVFDGYYFNKEEKDIAPLKPQTTLLKSDNLVTQGDLSTSNT